MDELVHLDATELAARIRAREVSPVEVVRALRERAEDVNPKVNALVTPVAAAEERARDAEAAVLRGEALGPLHGVPFTIKDTFDTAGTRTTRGSALYAERVPAEDATVVARLAAAGAIPLAKTNTPEFALWWETGNLVFGRTSNPWSLDRTAGGSSGGDAAGIAAGLTPFGIGSDLGGSIRAPAHYCGVVGLKASHGRTPLTGHWPEVIPRFMHAGPLARSVRDVALVLHVMSGPDGRDWHATPVPAPGVPEARAGLDGVRILRLADRCFGPTDPEVSTVVERAAEAARSLGATVDDGALASLEENDWNLKTLVLYGAEGSPFFGPLLAGREDELHPILRRRLAEPALPPIEAYVAAEAEVERLRREVTAVLGEYDLLLTPTAIVPAFPHEQETLVVGGETVPARATLRATLPFDLTGSPALSLPFALAGDGLPIGVQLAGRRFEEEALLAAAMALEAVSEVRGLRPRL